MFRQFDSKTIQAGISESLQSSLESQAPTPEASKPGSLLLKQKQPTCPWVHADTRKILLNASKALGIGDGEEKPQICDDNLYTKCVKIATASVSPPCSPKGGVKRRRSETLELTKLSASPDF